MVIAGQRSWNCLVVVVESLWGIGPISLDTPMVTDTPVYGQRSLLLSNGLDKWASNLRDGRGRFVWVELCVAVLMGILLRSTWIGT